LIDCLRAHASSLAARLLAATLEFQAARVKETSRSSTARPHLVAAEIAVFKEN